MRKNGDSQEKDKVACVLTFSSFHSVLSPIGLDGLRHFHGPIFPAYKLHI